MSKMSKTAALREAQNIVGRPIRMSATSYVVYHPYDRTKLNGPSGEMRADSYPKIVAQRAARVAEIALFLMGEHGRFDNEEGIDPVEYLVYKKGPMSAQAIVDAVLSM